LLFNLIAKEKQNRIANTLLFCINNLFNVSMSFLTDIANTKVVIIDNYDSFTYNLVHLVESIISTDVIVLLNDKFELDELEVFDRIILSPGPGLPQDAGKTMDVIQRYKFRKSILGVCLGHQAIGLAFGAELKNLETVYHGIETNIIADEQEPLFNNIKMPMLVGRYHSWVIDRDNLPEELIITATDDNRNIMAIKHKTLDVQGIQFHPESIMTAKGEELMKNWLSH
jgi:anthranilate synthase component 2